MATIDFVKMGFVAPLSYDDYWSKLVCDLFTAFPTPDLPRNLSVSALESTASSTQVRSIVCTATLCIFLRSF